MIPQFLFLYPAPSTGGSVLCMQRADILLAGQMHHFLQQAVGDVLFEGHGGDMGSSWSRREAIALKTGGG